MTRTKPTSGKVWRRPREEGYVITLPSGNSARLRPVALDTLLASGEIPDLLMPLVTAMLFEDKPEDEEQVEVKPDLVGDTVGLIALVVRASFLEPRVVDEPQADDEIALADISAEDKGAVFSLANQPARVLAGLSERQAQGLDTVSDGEGNGDAAE